MIHFLIHFFNQYIMLRKHLILLFLLSCIAIKGQDKALLPYIEFINNQKTDPVDYVFELFSKYDIVILGERDHRDTTQYILIEKIMSDPRFIENVGHVFTEVGVCNQTDNANKILKSSYNSEKDFTKELRNLYRNIDYEILWEKYNYWYFLNSIYRINKDLPQSDKISLHLTDVPFDWNECQDFITRKEFFQKIRSSNNRDIIMGFNIIKGFDQILQDNKEQRKKALVILNRPHSYQNYICTHRTKGELYPLNSAASYVFDYYPNNVANIMINWCKLQDNDYYIADGKWDAAFHFLGNKSVGFDMINSPFGDDLFDHYVKPIVDNTQYKNIFTGFIFYLPVQDWVLSVGIPDIITEDFHIELMRREHICSIVEERKKWSLKSIISYFNDRRTFQIENIDEELTLNLKKWNVK